MCGRYVITYPVSKTKKIVKSAIQVEDNENYNAHPYQKLPVIKKYINGNTLENLTWGIIPSWSKKKDFKPLTNARLETIDEKISFKKLIKVSRCIAIADGFYEWKREDKIKTPYYFSKEDDELMYFAGIYQNDQFCIITREATEKISTIHHREPMIINQSQINNYLNIKKDAMEILNSIKPPNLKFHEISKDVNNPINNDPALIKPSN